jgi:hypothetical protein
MQVPTIWAQQLVLHSSAQPHDGSQQSPQPQVGSQHSLHSPQQPQEGSQQFVGPVQ